MAKKAVLRLRKNAHPSLRVDEVRRFATALVFATILASPHALAEGQYIDLFPQERSDIDLILNTLAASVNDPEKPPPIILMLHGDLAHPFLRPHYDANKELIDKTARLAAYGIIDVKICETWMRNNDYTKADLFPFVETVPFGAGELERLAQEEDYREYSVPM